MQLMPKSLSEGSPRLTMCCLRLYNMRMEGNMTNSENWKMNIESGIVTEEMVAAAACSVKEKDSELRKRLAGVLRPVCIKRKVVGYRQSRHLMEERGFADLLVKELLSGNVMSSAPTPVYDEFGNESWTHCIMIADRSEPVCGYYLCYYAGDAGFLMRAGKGEELQWPDIPVIDVKDDRELLEPEISVPDNFAAQVELLIANGTPVSPSSRSVFLPHCGGQNVRDDSYNYEMYCYWAQYLLNRIRDNADLHGAETEDVPDELRHEMSNYITEIDGILRRIIFEKRRKLEGGLANINDGITVDMWAKKGDRIRKMFDELMDDTEISFRFESGIPECAGSLERMLFASKSRMMDVKVSSVEELREMLYAALKKEGKLNPRMRRFAFDFYMENIGNDLIGRYCRYRESEAEAVRHFIELRYHDSKAA